MEDVPIRSQMIRLGQLLKLAGVVDTGSEVKTLLSAGTVMVNGDPESRRGRQLHAGDTVQVGERGLRLMSAGPPAVSAGPGVTALGLAAARSVETSRPDRLIEDPFARPLFQAAGAGLPMLVEWPDRAVALSDAHALHLHGSRFIGLRTRFYDDVILAAAGVGVYQAVLLGAGLDTRAYRLDLPEDYRLFELDQPSVLEFKNAILDGLGASPRCQRITIGVDLREDWSDHLRAHTFDRDRPTAWIAEGLLPYLPPESQLGLLRSLHELSVPGSILAFDRIVGDPTAAGRLQLLSTRSGINMDGLLVGGQAADLRGFLAASGWAVNEQTVEVLAAQYGRDLSDPFATGEEATDAVEPPWLDTMFVSAALG